MEKTQSIQGVVDVAGLCLNPCDQGPQEPVRKDVTHSQPTLRCVRQLVLYTHEHNLEGSGHIRTQKPIQHIVNCLIGGGSDDDHWMIHRFSVQQRSSQCAQQPHHSGSFPSARRALQQLQNTQPSNIRFHEKAARLLLLLVEASKKGTAGLYPQALPGGGQPGSSHRGRKSNLVVRLRSRLEHHVCTSWSPQDLLHESRSHLH
mmetsp:Transcript_137473/g.310298  ORF Transcript_137473/g.310298 Transcript_137473/m.310298 type:complete len:203 (+) Transcript_137473:1036-1644(+)